MVFAFGRFSKGTQPPFAGVVFQERVIPVTDLLPGRALEGRSLLPLMDNWDANIAAIEAELRTRPHLQRAFALSEFSSHAPLPDARQIFCTGANYGRHVVEMVTAMGVGAETQNMNEAERRAFGETFVARQKAEGEPYVFMKPVTSIAGPVAPLDLPAYSAQIDWELELAAVIGRPTFQVAQGDAMAHVAGYMIVNDLTARDKVRRTDPGAIGPDWLGAKGSPGFLPTGPYLVPAAYVPNPMGLAMTLRVNDVIMQDDTTSDMTFDIARQIAAISARVRMLPGDILCTGSPAGNGVTRGIFLKSGDVMEAQIEGLGRQIVRCR